MKTETIIAIILGIVVGGGLAVFLATKVLTPMQKATTVLPITINELEREKDVVVATNSASLVIFSVKSPQTPLKVTSDKLTLEALVPSGSFVFIQSGIYEKSTPLSNALVKEVIPLAKGENTIEITAYHKTLPFGVQSKQLKIYYLPLN